MSDPVADLAELALALIQRAVRDLQSHGKYARLAWAWLMLPDTDADGAEIGWDLDDACRVLGADLACLRRALVARGYQFPPLPNVRGAARPTRGRRACAGLVHCQRCGVPVPTPDRRITRTCAACGTRLRPYYLRRHGLLSAEFRTTKTAARPARRGRAHPAPTPRPAARLLSPRATHARRLLRQDPPRRARIHAADHRAVAGRLHRLGAPPA